MSYYIPAAPTVFVAAQESLRLAENDPSDSSVFDPDAE
jgi:hypothetical protein